MAEIRRHNKKKIQSSRRASRTRIAEWSFNKINAISCLLNTPNSPFIMYSLSLMNWPRQHYEQPKIGGPRSFYWPKYVAYFYDRQRVFTFKGYWQPTCRVTQTEITVSTVHKYFPAWRTDSLSIHTTLHVTIINTVRYFMAYLMSTERRTCSFLTKMAWWYEKEVPC